MGELPVFWQYAGALGLLIGCLVGSAISVYKMVSEYSRRNVEAAAEPSKLSQSIAELAALIEKANSAAQDAARRSNMQGDGLGQRLANLADLVKESEENCLHRLDELEQRYTQRVGGIERRVDSLIERMDNWGSPRTRLRP